MKARCEAAKRRVREGQTRSPSPSDPVNEATLRELQTLLHEEVNGLPDKYRAPFVLCCLQGKSRAEAAAHLGWKEGTVAGRLAHAREQLRRRLGRRGIALSAALTALAIGDRGASAALARAVLTERIGAVLSFAASRTGVGAGLSTGAAALAEATLQGMAMAKIKASAVLLLISVVAASTAALAWHVPDGGRAPARLPAQPAVEPGANKPAVASADWFVDALPAEAQLRLGTVRFRLDGLYYSCAYSPDGKILAAGSGDCSVRLFDAATGVPIRKLRSARMDVTCVAFSRDDRVLASGSADSTIALWDLAGGNLVRKIFTPQRVIWALAFSPDGKTLLSGGEDNSLRLWDLVTGKELHRYEGHLGPVRSVALSPDGQFAALGSSDNTVRLWEIVTGKTIREYTGHTPRKGSEGSLEHQPVAFLPDGKLLASADEGPTVRLWDVASGKLIRGISYKQRGNIYALAFSPDGQTIASGSAGHELRLWDVATGKLRQQRLSKRSTTYNGWHHGGIPCVAFAPDGKTLAFGEDNRLGLWDSNLGQERYPSQVPASEARLTREARASLAYIGAKKSVEH
jgi:WD40 repeat protein